MNRFSTTPTALPGLMRVQRQAMADARGFLARLFCAEELAGIGWYGPIAKINHTHTAHCGTVRGLHYQRQMWYRTSAIPIWMNIINE